jgi:hypothetical protein
VGFDVVAVRDPETVKYRTHLGLATTSAAHHAELVARLEDLGAAPADVGQGDVPWMCLADPECNAFCVLGRGGRRPRSRPENPLSPPPRSRRLPAAPVTTRTEDKTA